MFVEDPGRVPVIVRVIEQDTITHQRKRRVKPEPDRIYPIVGIRGHIAAVEEDLRAKESGQLLAKGGGRLGMCERGLGWGHRWKRGWG